MAGYFTESNYENAVLQLLNEELGYNYIYGPDVERDYHSPLYEDVLLPSLQRINKSLPMDALTEAIYKLKNFETGTLLQKNMVFMDYLQNGVPVKYYDKGEERSTLVYLVDFKILPVTSSQLRINGLSLRTPKKTGCDSLCQWSPTRHCGVEVSVPRRNRCFRSIPPAPELYV